VCQKYGLVNSTIQKIWENKTKIISVFENSGSRIKRFGKQPERSDVEEALLKRFKHASGNVPVSGSFVMTTFVLTQF
jgi:lipoate-protein ligase A